MTSNDDDSWPWCETDLRARKMLEGYFSWKITGFGDHRDEFFPSSYANDVLNSHEFTLEAPDGSKTKWMLECTPRYKTDLVKMSVISRNQFDVKAKIES